VLKLHPEFLTRDGKKQFVVLPYEEFVAVRGALEDLEDLQVLREAKGAQCKARGISHIEVGRRLRGKAKSM
jgi:hypothetical protein